LKPQCHNIIDSLESNY